MKPLTYLLSAILLSSCQNKEGKKFDKLESMNWLIGSWEQKTREGILVESWKKENDSTYSGESYFINPKDTIHFENIRLIQKGDDLTYNALVTGQNNDEPIDFKLTSAAKNTFTFENPTHDYPQKIMYKKVSTTHLTATISGKQQGKVSQESYSMNKK